MDSNDDSKGAALLTGTDVTHGCARTVHFSQASSAGTRVVVSFVYPIFIDALGGRNASGVLEEVRAPIQRADAREAARPSRFISYMVFQSKTFITIHQLHSLSIEDIHQDS